MNKRFSSIFNVHAEPKGSAEQITLHTKKPILFISDLHLSSSLPQTTAYFKQFTEQIVSRAGALFILGDFFEYWIGDDTLQHDLFFKNLALYLRSIHQKNIPVFVMHGNRDFLLGKQFAQFAQVQLIQDPYLLTAFDQKILLTHGDQLCWLDTGYQRFRKISHCQLLQKAFFALPYFLRQKIARTLRTQSHATTDMTQHPQYDVTTAAVNHWLKKYAVQHILHGHTHRPAHHQHEAAERWVLSDWEFDHAPYHANYLQLDQQGLHLHPLSTSTLMI